MNQDQEKIYRKKIERALLVLPEGAQERYPLRTRLVHCAQIGEAAAEQVLESMMRRGEPEKVDAADLDLSRSAAEQGLCAFIILCDILDNAEVGN